MNALDMQRQMCDEGMALVNAGVSLQNAGDHENAEKNFTKAVDIMEKALAISYSNHEEEEAAVRLNTKMSRYIKMIKSQRAKAQGATVVKRPTVKFNILEMERLPRRYQGIVHLLSK
jgi:callose synthase